MDAQIQKVVDKMAEIANLKIDNWIDEDYTYMTYTSKKEAQFVNWLVEELSVNKALRKVMMVNPTTKKSILINTAQAFSNKYGFKISDNNAI